MPFRWPDPREMLRGTDGGVQQHRDNISAMPSRSKQYETYGNAVGVTGKASVEADRRHSGIHDGCPTAISLRKTLESMPNVTKIPQSSASRGRAGGSAVEAA